MFLRVANTTILGKFKRCATDLSSLIRSSISASDAGSKCRDAQ